MGKEYIERELLKQKLLETDFSGFGWFKANDCVDSIHAADVAPVVHGRWIDPPEAYGISLDVMPDDSVCSICSARFNIYDNCTELFKHCPNCGAKMDLEAHNAQI